MTAWNPPEMDECALPCCHYAFQCYTTELTVEERIRAYAKRHNETYEKFKALFDDDAQWNTECDIQGVPRRKLSLMWSQRSTDTMLGLPFDIASYGALTHMLCQQCNMIPDELIVNSADTHLYLNSLDAVKEQLTRNPYHNLPQLRLNPLVKDMFGYKYSDIEVTGYDSHPAIKVQIAV